MKEIKFVLRLNSCSVNQHNIVRLLNGSIYNILPNRFLRSASDEDIDSEDVFVQKSNRKIFSKHFKRRAYRVSNGV